MCIIKKNDMEDMKRIMPKQMKTMKIWRIALAMAAVLSLASCSSDDENAPTEPTEECLYELSDVSFADGEPQRIFEHHLDTTYVYNDSHSVTMPVTYTMFGDLNDTLTVSLTDGSDYVSRLNLQGEIRFPSYMTDGQPVFNSEPVMMPVVQSQAVVESNLLYTASTSLPPRTFLKYTGTYHCIVDSYVFTAYYRGQATGEMICVKGRFCWSRPTIAPISGNCSTYAEIHSIP